MSLKLKKIITRIMSLKHNSGNLTNKFCCICNNDVVGFQPYRDGWKNAPQLMSVLEVIGSDLDNFSCTICGAHDRERHLFLFFEALKLFDKFEGASILHFAPEKRLAKIIESKVPLSYIKADLYPSDSTIEKVDMTNICYDSESFDIVIANHVLEHIPDDIKALSELRRVLKKGGMAILQTPYSAKLNTTLQDSGIDDDNSRLHLYGQEDHVRLYGLDIFDRFASVGLLPDIKVHDLTLSNIDSSRYGVNPREPLFLYTK